MAATFGRSALPSLPVEAPVGHGGAGLLWITLQPFRRHIVSGIAVGILWSAGKLAVPALVAAAIDQGIRGHDPYRLAWLVGAILLVGMTGALLAGLRRLLAMGAAFRVESALRDRLFRHLLHLDPAWHARTSAGQIVTRITSDLQQIQQPFVNIPLTASNSVLFLGASILLLMIDPQLAFCAMGPIFVLFLLARRFNAALAPRAAVLQDRAGRFAALVTDAVSGVRAVKGLGLEESEARRAAVHAQQVQDAALAMAGVRATYLPLIDLLPAIGVAAVLWIGGQRVAAGTMSIGQLVQFSYYVMMLIGPLRHLGITIAQFQRAFVSAGLINAILTVPPTLHPGVASPDERQHVPADAEVCFERVSFAYDEDAPLLRDLDFTIARGETVAIVGAAGSGKTTLVGLIARLHDASAGRIVIGGHDVRDLPVTHLRAQVGIVFEDAFLFSGTVGDNIAFARPDAAPAAIEAAARAAGAHDFIADMDLGYDALIGERGHSLSGGQRQRIALARTLITDPAILILDAATSAVDASKEEEIRETMANSFGHRTTIMIAHKPSTLRMADRVLVLDNGQIVAEGRHDDLLRTNATYRHVLDAASSDAALPVAAE